MNWENIIISIITIIISSTIILYRKEIYRILYYRYNYPLKLNLKERNIEIKNKNRQRVICNGFCFLFNNKNELYLSLSINLHGSSTGGYIGTKFPIYDKKDIIAINKAKYMKIYICIFKAIKNPDKTKLGYPYIIETYTNKLNETKKIKLREKHFTLKKRKIRKFLNN
jgi:hypothetical protein